MKKREPITVAPLATITNVDLTAVTGGGRISIPHTPGTKNRAAGVVVT
jgi:hypothetical protein